MGDGMTGAGHRLATAVFVGLGLLAIAVVPFLVIPALIAVSFAVAVRLRTTAPEFSRAWLLAGLSAGLLAAAVAASIVSAPQVVGSVLLLVGFLAYAVTVVLFGRGWSRGSKYPTACWLSAVSFGLVGLLTVVLMGAFGRGIALADQGRSSWLVDALILISVAGIPMLLIVGLVAFWRTRRQ